MIAEDGTIHIMHDEGGDDGGCGCFGCQLEAMHATLGDLVAALHEAHQHAAGHKVLHALASVSEALDELE